MPGQTETIVFGGGCFWCTEAVFLRLQGVRSVTSGYAGGPSASSGQTPTYEEVSTGKIGHAEVIRVEYDPAAIPFSKLLEVFFMAHDPTTVNRQGADTGTQYRSIILYTTESQKLEVERYIAELTAVKALSNPIVTEIKPLDRFGRPRSTIATTTAGTPRSRTPGSSSRRKWKRWGNIFPNCCGRMRRTIDRVTSKCSNECSCPMIFTVSVSRPR